jgi:hypothetical protein
MEYTQLANYSGKCAQVSLSMGQSVGPPRRWTSVCHVLRLDLSPAPCDVTHGWMRDRSSFEPFHWANLRAI